MRHENGDVSVVVEELLHRTHPLGRVRLKDTRLRYSADLQCQLPPQIDGVVDARVQALRRSTAMSMRRISAEEDPVLCCECFGDALPNGVQRPPVDLLEFDLEGLHGLDGLAFGDFLCHAVGVLGGDLSAVCVANARRPMV